MTVSDLVKALYGYDQNLPFHVCASSSSTDEVKYYAGEAGGEISLDEPLPTEGEPVQAVVCFNITVP